MRLLPLILLLTPLAAPAAQFYLYDDGTLEFSSIAAANHVLAVGFQAQAGKLDIAGMMHYNMLYNDNHPITYVLWRDPNNDGNLADAQVLQTVNSTLSAVGWQSVTFPALSTFNEGDWFYVGTYFTDPVYSYFAGAVDTGPLLGSGNSRMITWTIGTPVDLNNLASGTITSITSPINSNPANLLIRATVAEPVPEPSAFWLSAAGLGLAGLCLRRRP